MFLTLLILIEAVRLYVRVYSFLHTTSDLVVFFYHVLMCKTLELTSDPFPHLEFVWGS